MNLLREVGSNLVKMFVGDAWLTAGVLVVVALTGVIIEFGGVPALAGGAVLLLGCIAVLVATVVLHARRHRG
jgi:heme A synthase